MDIEGLNFRCSRRCTMKRQECPPELDLVSLISFILLLFGLQGPLAGDHTVPDANVGIQMVVLLA
jgi:hypothetical protein